jgi:guanosine-3',5'-bis(diphosphate) 3'-pyrophosphohydrolase
LEAQLLSKAIALASTAHGSQRDKQGEPYILHPLRVMFSCQTPEERIAAVLHDIVEDTDITLEALAVDFPPAIVDAVDALTHRKGEKYLQYIERLAPNNIARAVKIADIRDNYFNPARPVVGFRPEVVWDRKAGLEMLLAHGS